MALPGNLGTKLSLASTAILTTYVAGTTINAGRPKRIKFALAVTTVGGTNATSFQAKIQASQDGTNWTDVKSEDESDAVVGAAVLEYTANVSADTTQRAILSVDGSYKFLRIAAKFTGGVGQALETIVATAYATAAV